MAKRRYSDDERAAAVAAVAANAGNTERTANQIGIPEATLRHWVKQERHPEAANLAEEKKDTLAEVFEAVARRSLGFVSDEKLEEAGPVDLLKVAGIAVDKARLLRGQPTEIIEDKGALARADAFRSLYAEVSSQRGAPAVVAGADDRPQPLPEGPPADGEATALPGPDVP